MFNIITETKSIAAASIKAVHVYVQPDGSASLLCVATGIDEAGNQVELGDKFQHTFDMPAIAKIFGNNLPVLFAELTAAMVEARAWPMDAEGNPVPPPSLPEPIKPV